MKIHRPNKSGFGNAELFGIVIPKSWDWGSGRMGLGPLVAAPGNSGFARDEWGNGLGGAIVNTPGKSFYGFLTTQFWQAVDPLAHSDRHDLRYSRIPLDTLIFDNAQTAKELSKTAVAMLVFPDIIKAGLVIGGQYGKGVLREGGKTTGYYSTMAASYGLQAGAQYFGYAMLFMNEKALEYLRESDGWEVGIGPSVVLVDEGLAETLTTTTAQDDVYVFIFDQSGLMAGLGIQGSKITRIDPEE